MRLATLLILSLSLLIPQWAYSSTTHYLRAADKIVELRAHISQNEDGYNEVAYEHLEVRSFLPDTAAFVLYGRDLDQDGKIDAWFIPEDDGIFRAIDRPSQTPDGWDVAKNILTHDAPLQNTPVSKLLLNTAVWFSFGASSVKSTLQQAGVDQINAHSKEIALDRLRRTDLVDPAALLLAYQNVQIECKRIEQEVGSDGMRNSFLGFAGDLGFVAAGSALVKGGSMLFKWTGKSLLASNAGLRAAAMYARYVASVKTSGTLAIARMSGSIAVLSKRYVSRGAVEVAEQTAAMDLTCSSKFWVVRLTTLKAC